MPRPVDERKRRKALRVLRQIEQALEDKAANFSGWEDEFVRSIEARVEKFGSAFADPAKGAPDEPLSRLQQQKLKEVRDKARGKEAPSAPGGGLKRRALMRGRRPDKRGETS